MSESKLHAKSELDKWDRSEYEIITWRLNEPLEFNSGDNLDTEEKGHFKENAL